MKQRLSKTAGSDRTGFTFIEIMITFALFMVLASVGVGSYFRYYHFSLVSNDASKITKVLHETRFKALKNAYSSDYGVHFDTVSSELVVFRDSYTPSNSENDVTTLEQLDITNLNLQPNPGVTNNVVFENITGKTQNSGSFTVSKDDFIFTYSINEQGAFE